MGVAAPAPRRQERPRLLPEGLRQAPAAAAAVAGELDVARAPALAQFSQPQRPLARNAAVEELDPREVVEVAVGTGHQIARGVRRRRTAPAVARAPLVDVARLLRPPGIGLEGEQAGLYRSEQAAQGTPQPAREGRDRDSRAVALGHDRRREQALDLVTDLSAHRREQPRLGDRLAEHLRPVVEPQHERRHLRQLNRRADAEGVQQLARAQLADVVARLQVAACASGTGADRSGASQGSPGGAMPLGRRASGTAASTLRRDVGTVHRDQPSMLGSRSSE